MRKSIGRWSLISFFIAYMGCGAQPAQRPGTSQSAQLRFAPEIALGKAEANPSTPFLRYSPDGRLFAVWTEDHDRPWPAGKPHFGHKSMRGDRAPSSMRNTLVASSSDGGKTVYMVDREADVNKICNPVLRKSTDGGATFGAPVEIDNDGWQVPSCPHFGPSIGRDRRGKLHVSWFTQGRSEQEAVRKVGIQR